MSEWVLFLGAGASVSAPTCLPDFSALAQGVLGGIGWHYQDGQWLQKGFPAFADPRRSVSPEVLFGTLQNFGVNFAPAVARKLGTCTPNAAHQVAAAVLEAGGIVWTTNVDLAVEGAWAARNTAPLPRYGRQAARPGQGAAAASPLAPLAPLEGAGPGGLVKFHGTAEAPGTLAFADRDLMTPLPDHITAHLAGQARGRTLVFYGYAGADADLADLLEQSIGHAQDVIWFEPSLKTRESIGLFFPTAQHAFQPPAFAADLDTTDFRRVIPPTATAFLQTAARAGYPVDGTDRSQFTSFQEPRPSPEINVGTAPGLISARLIQHFGSSREETRALRKALRIDLGARRWRLLPAYVRWTLSRSVYYHGAAGRIVAMLAPLRRLLNLPGVRRFGDPIITLQFALLLSAGKWRKIETLADWSLRHRRRKNGTPFPSDYYYRAHALRYTFQPQAAAGDAEAAIRGLADARDPERLAGALFEAGAAALYQGRFDVALRRAFELQYRRGRYAIPRWQSWGGLLEALAHCHLRNPDAAAQALERAASRFKDESYEGALADIDTAELLTERVRRATDPALAGQPLPVPLPRHRTRQRQDDLDLVLGDLELASGHDEGVARARQHYEATAGRRTGPVAAAWAALGLAEVARREGHTARAAQEFAAVAADARECGATWLEAQALLGVHLTAPAQAEAPWHDLCARSLFGEAPITSLIFGEPRVLWTVTI